MTVLRALSMAMVLGMAVQVQPACADGRLPQGGSYEVTARLELPHLERWAVDKKTIICLPTSLNNGDLPIPIVSANNPFGEPSRMRRTCCPGETVRSPCGPRHSLASCLRATLDSARVFSDCAQRANLS